MKTLTERCEIELQALALGECEFKIKKSWYHVKVDERFIFDWSLHDYRIKKELRVIWVTHYDNGKIKNVYRSIVCGATKFIEVIE